MNLRKKVYGHLKEFRISGNRFKVFTRYCKIKDIFFVKIFVNFDKVSKIIAIALREKFDFFKNLGIFLGKGISRRFRNNYIWFSQNARVRDFYYASFYIFKNKMFFYKKILLIKDFSENIWYSFIGPRYRILNKIFDVFAFRFFLKNLIKKGLEKFSFNQIFGFFNKDFFLRKILSRKRKLIKESKIDELQKRHVFRFFRFLSFSTIIFDFFFFEFFYFSKKFSFRNLFFDFFSVSFFNFFFFCGEKFNFFFSDQRFGLRNFKIIEIESKGLDILSFSYTFLLYDFEYGNLSNVYIFPFHSLNFCFFLDFKSFFFLGIYANYFIFFFYFEFLRRVFFYSSFFLQIFNVSFYPGEHEVGIFELTYSKSTLDKILWTHFYKFHFLNFFFDLFFSKYMLYYMPTIRTSLTLSYLLKYRLYEQALSFKFSKFFLSFYVSFVYMTPRSVWNSYYSTRVENEPLQNKFDVFMVFFLFQLLFLYQAYHDQRHLWRVKPVSFWGYFSPRTCFSAMIDVKFLIWSGFVRYLYSFFLGFFFSMFSFSFSIFQFFFFFSFFYSMDFFSSFFFRKFAILFFFPKFFSKFLFLVLDSVCSAFLYFPKRMKRKDIIFGKKKEFLKEFWKILCVFSISFILKFFTFFFKRGASLFTSFFFFHSWLFSFLDEFFISRFSIFLFGLSHYMKVYYYYYLFNNLVYSFFFFSNFAFFRLFTNMQIFEILNIHFILFVLKSRFSKLFLFYFYFFFFKALRKFYFRMVLDDNLELLHIFHDRKAFRFVS